MVGKIELYGKKIGLDADRKRFWPKQITSVHSDLYVGSMPLDVNRDGRLYAKDSDLSFYQEQEDYNPYDSEDYYTY